MLSSAMAFPDCEFRSTCLINYHFTMWTRVHPCLPPAFTIASPTLKYRHAFRQKSRRGLFLVFRLEADPEQRSFNQQAFRQARVQSFVHSIEGERHALRCVRKNLLQDGLGSRD